jgi:hypothetical protein
VRSQIFKIKKFFSFYLQDYFEKTLSLKMKNYFGVCLQFVRTFRKFFKMHFKEPQFGAYIENKTKTRKLWF